MGKHCSDPGLLCHMGIQIRYCLIMITLVLKRGKISDFYLEQFQNNASIRKKKVKIKSKTFCRSYKTYIPADHDHYFAISDINY